MGLWILAVLCVIVIWVGSYLALMVGLTVPMWLRILLTALVVAAVIAVVLYKRWRAMAKARALEREMLRQAEQQAMSARPDRRAEIIELQAQFQRGLAALKQSKIGSAQGTSVLYSLPWYIIIGPPGAGKTTALQHSGLVFPHLDPRGGGVRGVGGTRNCDWWFTNEAILLDTAGRYTTEADDHEEWIAFLAMLKRFRPKRPINGLLVAVSIPEFIDATEEQIEATASKLRARIDEVITRLQTVVPVYLVFTKADLVAGFIEFWGDLRKSERGQIWGATFGLDGQAIAEPAQTFEQEFDAMVERVHARALVRLHSERQEELREKIYQFPLELQSLRSNLSELVGALFRKNSFQEPPIFRGFYFTSGTQEGRPLDRVIANMARAFNLNRQVAEVAEQPKESKSYFVTDLFRRVVFADQSLAGRTAAEARRQRLTQLAIGAGVLTVVPILVGGSACSYVKNRELIDSTKKASTELAKVNWSDGRPVAQKVSKLDAMQQSVLQLDKWRDGAPISMRWGMYSGDDLYPSARNAYAASIRTGVLVPSKAFLERELKEFPDAEVRQSADPRSERYNERYNQLKLYLMLSDEPSAIEHMDVDWAAPKLASIWAETLPPDQVADEEKILPHAKYYLELVKRGEVPRWSRDSGAIGRARSILAAVPQFDRTYEDLIRVANTDTNIKPIRREDIFVWSVSAYVASQKNLQVDRAYTKPGWEKIREQLRARKTALSGEPWVLGDSPQRSGEDVERDVRRLRELYFQRYRDAWRDFLHDLDVYKPNSAEESLKELNALSEPEWPYQRLIRVLAENVMLDVTPEEAGSQDPTLDDQSRIKEAAKKVGEVVQKGVLGAAADAGAAAPPRPMSLVERSFRPILKFGLPPANSDPDKPPSTGLSQYQTMLAKLVGVLTDLRDSQTPPKPDALAAEFQDAFRNTSTLLADQDGFTRPLVSPLLMNPITAAWASVVNEAGNAAEGLWEVAVWQKWFDTMQGRYPFADSPKDVTLKDFTTFFRPKTGTLWGFYEANLKGSLEQRGASFEPTKRFQARMGFDPGFLDNCLRRGDEITSVLFAGSAEAPVFPFQVNLHSVSRDVSEVVLEIDGASKTYRNEPEQWLAAQWPAKDAEVHGARIRVRGYSGLDEEISRPGDFGFFRLLDAADSLERGTAGGKAQGAPVLVGTWKLRSNDGAFVMIDIRPVQAEHPLTPPKRSFFKGYTCPRRIQPRTRR